MGILKMEGMAMGMSMNMVPPWVGWCMAEKGTAVQFSCVGRRRMRREGWLVVCFWGPG